MSDCDLRARLVQHVSVESICSALFAPVALLSLFAGSDNRLSVPDLEAPLIVFGEPLLIYILFWDEDSKSLKPSP